MPTAAPDAESAAKYAREVREDSSTKRKVALVCEERRDVCLGCGHCAAVCKAGAVQVEGLEAGSFGALRPLEIDEAKLLTLFEQRRAVRRFKEAPVEREMLERIIEGAHRAPTATGKRCVGLIVVDKKEKIRAISGLLFQKYEWLEKTLANPVGRFVIRQKIGAQQLGQLRSFAMRGMHWYLRWHQENGKDEILRDAPALMLFHAPMQEPMGDESCLVAALHAMFMAHVHGVGSFVNGLVPSICNRSPELHQLLGLDDESEVHTCLCLGYPKYEFRKSIVRRMANVRYLD